MKKLGKKNEELIESVEAYRSCSNNPGCKCHDDDDPTVYYDNNDDLYWEVFF